MCSIAIMIQVYILQLLTILKSLDSPGNHHWQCTVLTDLWLVLKLIKKTSKIMLCNFDANFIYCKELKEQEMQCSTSLITLQCNIHVIPQPVIWHASTDSKRCSDCPVMMYWDSVCVDIKELLMASATCCASMRVCTDMLTQSLGTPVVQIRVMPQPIIGQLALYI